MADLVYPVLTHALRVKAQLARGERRDFEKEQSALKGLLKSDAEARRWSEYIGDPTASVTGRGADNFLGIRYALACWLDEIFIFDSPWREEWKENTLENALYGTRIRAEKFWEQVRKAEARTESDALEVYFLCAMLGFRGELRMDPDQLRARLAALETQISQHQKGEPPLPTGPPPVIDVDPLRGAARFRAAMIALSTAVLLLIPAVAFYLVSRLR